VYKWFNVRILCGNCGYNGICQAVQFSIGILKLGRKIISVK
jgi:hypothetical protein